ncbi:MAG: BamA/TamA family outer membrane protein, partial [Nitrospinaceae bacterium]|nr:BamA/TamA family outer membrane protein [Nitrospinaceae bacterium]NIS24520.1 BamA/TamA family outer membrane protein [candidate division KSB1 bacterium]NIR54955.1 BamA/TamA family outer membrane protein [Nitrospinaceae bacterium]NIT82197.1 BamA/TamA family outer membrane protein [Nitrospinaceae bacterium]NIU44441.1 BamA/TamA family outer membrane protein [Nitrospinaceae bacterium]
RDDFLNPSTGWRHVVRLEIAGGPLGGTNFLRSGYEITYYHPLIEKLVLAMHGEVNYADGYGGDDLPIFERYFMGGANSLRG